MVGQGSGGGGGTWGMAFELPMPGTDLQLASLLVVTGGKYSLFSNFL